MSTGASNPAAGAGILPPVDPAAAAAAGATGGTTPSAPVDAWYAKPELGFDRDTMDYMAAKNYQSLADSIKAQRQFETLARDRNAMTGPEKGKEMEWDGWSKLGWEADATKYAVESPKPENFTYDEGLHAALVKTAHGQRLPAAQVKPLLDTMATYISDQVKGAEANALQVETQLKSQLQQEWGPNYNKNLELSRRAMQTLGIGAQDATILEALLGASSEVKLFHKIGLMLGEDNLVVNTNAGGGFGNLQSPEAARAERLNLQSDKDFMASLTDPRHPSHAANKIKRQKLIDAEAKAS